ncbi:hypothetical protein CEXT_374631 [Caerostris extrusa]|uniref:Uncharacterized protein n=1 Tax=Caerostris extrusa TaxID=172846 RepID=A0AAV4MZE3_CAEEX|nr:hypothetical protein CEXT_374631 [Caerostris extrusa]
MIFYHYPGELDNVSGTKIPRQPLEETVRPLDTRLTAAAEKDRLPVDKGSNRTVRKTKLFYYFVLLKNKVLGRTQDISGQVPRAGFTM